MENQYFLQLPKSQSMARTIPFPDVQFSLIQTQTLFWKSPRRECIFVVRNNIFLHAHSPCVNFWFHNKIYLFRFVMLTEVVKTKILLLETTSSSVRRKTKTLNPRLFLWHVPLVYRADYLNDIIRWKGNTFVCVSAANTTRLRTRHKQSDILFSDSAIAAITCSKLLISYGTLRFEIVAKEKVEQF